MAQNKLDANDLVKYVLLILYIITGTLSNFGAIDILAPQWIYLGSVNILSCLYFLFLSPESFSNGFNKLFKTTFIYIYIFYLLWNAFSYFYAINPSETIINLPRIGNTFFAIFFSFFLTYSLPNKFNFIVRLFLVFLVAELAVYFNDFITLSGKEGFKVMDAKGFAGNKNITAASIAFKLPFILFLLHTSKRLINRLVILVVLFGGLLAVSLIEARAAILSTIIVFILFLIYQGYQIIKQVYTVKQGLLNIGYTIVPYFIALFMNIVITNNINRGTITDTVGRIAFTEESSNGRFQYWSDALDYVLENPILASGLGNWKIASISEGKEHINGYTVPYHAHNDFIHVFTETGILGGIAYVSIFICLTTYLFLLLYKKYKAKGVLEIKYFFLLLPLIVYGIDAGLNFPVARPLMQSSLAIFCGLVLVLYLSQNKKEEVPQNNQITKHRLVLGLILLLLIPGLTVHIISYNSLRKQGLLLYEFNNARYNMSRAQLDEISHDFPNLTETAMPIKTMKARYYYLQGNREEAYEMIDQGAKDNPQIYFSENLKAQFLFNEGKVDSAYVYAKRAFEGLPNNMPHYDMYMKTLVIKKDINEIEKTFNLVQSLAGNTKTIWTIYIRSLAQTRSLGDPYAMEKAATAYQLYPEDETIFSLYRILTYGQQRMIEAEEINKQATSAYNNKEYLKAAELFSQAFDKDPLQCTFSLNAGLAYYEARQFDNAIRYLDLSNTSKKANILEKAMRYKGLSLLLADRKGEACAIFLKLKNTYPKRMYQQEFQKYCLAQNN